MSYAENIYRSLWPGRWNQVPRRLLEQDVALMRRLARWRLPRWLRLWMLLASRAGNGGLWCVAAAGVLAFGGHGRGLALASAVLATALAVASFVTLKTWIRRPRPDAAPVPAGAHRSRLLCRLAPNYRDQFSFPSGHSLTGFAIATSLGFFYPHLGLCLVLCAFSVATSRLLLGLHFLTDVVAGCLLGSAVGYVSVLVLLVR